MSNQLLTSVPVLMMVDTQGTSERESTEHTGQDRLGSCTGKCPCHTHKVGQSLQSLSSFWNCLTEKSVDLSLLKNIEYFIDKFQIMYGDNREEQLRKQKAEIERQKKILEDRKRAIAQKEREKRELEQRLRERRDREERKRREEWSILSYLSHVNQSNVQKYQNETVHVQIVQIK